MEKDKYIKHFNEVARCFAEIKEIIKLNCEEEIEVKYFSKDDSIVDTTMDYSQLLDYITNLQEYKTTIEMEFKREYAKRYLEERRKEEPHLLYPDSDEIYKRYYELKEKLLNVKEYIKERTEFGEYDHAYPGVLNQDEVRHINTLLEEIE